MNEIGLEHFEREVLCECCSRDELNKAERYWIKTLDAMNPDIGYNRCFGGNNNSGFHQSDYQKQRAREASLGRKHTTEEKAKMSVRCRGRTNGHGNKGHCYVHYGTKNVGIDPVMISAYLDSGYMLGFYYNRDNQKKFQNKYANGTYINDGMTVRYIDKGELDAYLLTGWSVGKIKGVPRPGLSNAKKNKVGVRKDGAIRYIDESQISEYVSNGYRLSENYLNRLKK